VRCTMTRHIIVHSGLSLGRVAGSHDAADVDPLLAVAPMSIMSVYHPLRTANKLFYDRPYLIYASTLNADVIP
jgi:hypothetical protein